MTRRSVVQLAELENAILALSRKVGKGKGEERLFGAEVLIQRFRRAVERDKAGSAIPDGYPPGSGFDGGGGGLRVTVFADEHGPQESMEVTGVEYAIFLTDEAIAAEEDRKPKKDNYHALTLGVEVDLARMAEALSAARGKLDRLENLDKQNPDAASALEGCASCVRYRDGSGRTYFSPVYRGSLCQWCYGVVNDAITNPDGLLPAVELIERRARGQYITAALVEQVTRAQQAKKAG